MPSTDLRQVPLEQAAQMVEGCVLVLEERILLIREVVSRDDKHCERYHGVSEPLFRDHDRVKIFVAPYSRGKNQGCLIFIATAGKTCLQVQAVEDEGRTIKGPMKVAAHLKLRKGGSYSYHFNGTVLRILR